MTYRNPPPPSTPAEYIQLRQLRHLEDWSYSFLRDLDDFRSRGFNPGSSDDNDIALYAQLRIRYDGTSDNITTCASKLNQFAALPPVFSQERLTSVNERLCEAYSLAVAMEAQFKDYYHFALDTAARAKADEMIKERRSKIRLSLQQN